MEAAIRTQGEVSSRELDVEPAAEGELPPDEAAGGVSGRLSASAPVIGLVCTFLFGFAILASGIGYLAWPGSSRPTAPAVPAAAPPAATPVDVDQPKSLREVLGEGADKGPPAVQPMQPGFPRPRFGAMTK